MFSYESLKSLNGLSVNHLKSLKKTLFFTKNYQVVVTIFIYLFIYFVEAIKEINFFMTEVFTILRPFIFALLSVMKEFREEF